MGGVWHWDICCGFLPSPFLFFFPISPARHISARYIDTSSSHMYTSICTIPSMDAGSRATGRPSVHGCAIACSGRGRAATWPRGGLRLLVLSCYVVLQGRGCDCGGKPLPHILPFFACCRQILSIGLSSLQHQPSLLLPLNPAPGPFFRFPWAYDSSFTKKTKKKTDRLCLFTGERAPLSRSETRSGQSTRWCFSIRLGVAAAAHWLAAGSNATGTRWPTWGPGACVVFWSMFGVEWFFFLEALGGRSSVA